MNKAELIREVSIETGESQKVVGAILQQITDSIGNELDNRNDVAIAGFGKFSTKDVAARTARNPRTGEPIQVDAKVKPVFKFAKGFYEG